MASTTPNIGLTLPAGTEGWKRSVINGNFTILDTKIGAVGNTSLQSQINTLSSQLAQKVRHQLIESMDDLISFFTTQKVALTRVNSTVGNLLCGSQRQGLCTGFEISSEYIGFTFVDSYGEFTTGWITSASGVVTRASQTRKGRGLQANSSTTFTLTTSGRYTVTTIGPSQATNSLTNIRVDGAGNLGIFTLVAGSNVSITSNATNKLTISNSSGSAINAFIDALEGTAT